MIPLVDQHKRQILKLRISLLDTCNLRCNYCMPEDMSFMPRERLLSPHRIQEIAADLVAFGIRDIRLTGGEPTLRPEFLDIVHRLSQLPLRRLGLTSNGVTLGKFLEPLAASKLRSINISLDSLDAATYHRITRRDVFKRVYDTLLEAKKLGFQTKVNCVLMKGFNDSDILPFAEFSAETGIEVRFLELMKIGQACSSQLREAFMPADEAIDRLLSRYSLDPVAVDQDSTSFVYKLNNGARIGFIASESKPFCGHCSRWRLTADGFLRACLMSNKGVNVRDAEAADYQDLLTKLLPMKPTSRIEKIHQDMYQIGG